MIWLANSDEHRIVNLDNVEDIFISCNYLKLTMKNGREQSFIYGIDAVLYKLYDAILNFIKYHNYDVFDCCEFVKNLTK